MVDIIPAILPQSLEELTDKLARVHFAPMVQIDIVDGIYAPNTTWPFSNGDKLPGEPLHTQATLQFDLMLAHPEAHIDAYVRLGAKQLIVHARSEGAHAALELVREMRQEFGLQAGIALMSTAHEQDLRSFEGLFDFIQVMGIEHIGFQGHLFDKRSADLVASIRAARPHMVIQVDGGVALGNVLRLARAGANRLVAGSAIFKAHDPQAACTELHREANCG